MRSRSLVLLVAATSIALLGCDEDGPISNLRPDDTGTPAATAAPDPDEPGNGDGETAAPEPEPQPEPQPEPAPEPETEPAPEPDPEPDAPVTPNPIAPDDSSLVPILLGIGLLVLAAVVIGALAGRRSKPDGRTAPTVPPTPSAQIALLTNAQWIHDHLALELFAVPPADAQQRWVSERRRLDDVAIGAQQQFVNGGGDAWSGLSRTMTALATSLDTNLRLRAQEPPDPTLVQESTAVVNRQRAMLIQLVAALWPTATTQR